MWGPTSIDSRKVTAELVAPQLEQEWHQASIHNVSETTIAWKIGQYPEKCRSVTKMPKITEVTGSYKVKANTFRDEPKQFFDLAAIK